MLAPSIASAAPAPKRTAAHGNGAMRVEPGRAGMEWLALFTRSALGERHVSASTLEAYTLDLAMLSRWAAARDADLLELTPTDLTRYVVERAAQGVQLSTLARHLSSFRRFLSFLLSHGAIAGNPAATVPVPRALRPRSGLIRDDVLRSLLRAPRRQFPSPASAYQAERDHAIVCMLYGTGLGISDVRLLRWQQIDQHLLLSRDIRPPNDPAGAVPCRAQMGHGVRAGAGRHAIRPAANRASPQLRTTVFVATPRAGLSRCRDEPAPPGRARPGT